MEVSSFHDTSLAQHLAVSYIKPVLSRMMTPNYLESPRAPARKELPWGKVIYTLLSGPGPRTAQLDQGLEEASENQKSAKVTRREKGRRWMKTGTRLT